MIVRQDLIISFFQQNGFQENTTLIILQVVLYRISSLPQEESSPQIKRLSIRIYKIYIHPYMRKQCNQSNKNYNQGASSQKKGSIKRIEINKIDIYSCFTRFIDCVYQLFTKLCFSEYSIRDWFLHNLSELIVGNFNFNNIQIQYLRIAYNFSKLESIPDVIKARELAQNKRYEEASEHFQRSTQIFKYMGSEEIQSRKEFYKLALENQLYIKKFQNAYTIINQLLTLDPKLRKKYLTEYYLLSQIVGKNVPLLDQNDKAQKLISLAAKNVIQRNSEQVIEASQIPDEYYENSQRVGNLIGISNYLSFTKELKFKSRMLQIPEGEKCISPIVRNMNHQFNLKIDEAGHQLKVDQVLPKLTRYSRQIFPIAYLVYNSKCYNKKQIGNWATLFLKHSEGYAKQKLYRPLALLSMILFDSQNFVSSEGLISAAFDYVQKQKNLKDHTNTMLSLCKARIINQIKGREKEAEQIRFQHLPKFEDSRLLLQMIL